MQHFQTSLFYDLQELIRNSPLLRKYYYLFKALDLSALSDRNDPDVHRGRTGHSQHAILRAFIIKHLEGIKSVPLLIDYLNSFPALLEMCGFELGNLPDETQFYRFLKNTKNSTLKAVHKKHNDLLIQHDIIALDEFILDSKPVMAATKENNLCPANHTSFYTGKCYGCTKYIDVTNDARSMVPRDSRQYKESFKGRQVVEQYFSRLGDREVEQTTHYGFTAIKNQMTIAHLTASLIAVAAATLLGQPDKIRCYRTFADPVELRRTG